MEQRRVVVTGIGTINPIGNNIEEYFRNLEQGVSGADIITAFDATKFSSRIFKRGKAAYEVNAGDDLSFLM